MPPKTFPPVCAGGTQLGALGRLGALRGASTQDEGTLLLPRVLLDRRKEPVEIVLGLRIAKACRQYNIPRGDLDHPALEEDFAIVGKGVTCPTERAGQSIAPRQLLLPDGGGFLFFSWLLSRRRCHHGRRADTDTADLGKQGFFQFSGIDDGFQMLCDEGLQIVEKKFASATLGSPSFPHTRVGRLLARIREVPYMGYPAEPLSSRFLHPLEKPRVGIFG